jgi:predicted enzyme related to lactoylglutathione lyase
MAKIRHIAIFSDDTANLAKFYADVFEMKINGQSNEGAFWMTDGYMDIAILPRRNDMAPEGVHHFGITIEPEEKEGVMARLKERGHERMTPPPGRPYVEDALKDADGNKFDLSTSRVKKDGEKIVMKDEEKKKEKELV